MILKKRWSILLLKLLKEAKHLKDKEMIKQIDQLILIPTAVSEAAIRHYLLKAEGLYRIAFYQFRS